MRDSGASMGSCVCSLGPIRFEVIYRFLLTYMIHVQVSFDVLMSACVCSFGPLRLVVCRVICGAALATIASEFSLGFRVLRRVIFGNAALGSIASEFMVVFCVCLVCVWVGGWVWVCGCAGVWMCG